MARSITIAFAGTGEVSYEAVRDLLNDWLGVTPKEDEQGPYGELPDELDLRVIVPAETGWTGDALDAVLDYTAYLDLPFTATGTDGGIVSEIANDAENSIDTEDVAQALVEFLVTSDSEEKYLILAWGDSDEADENTEAVLAAAVDAGIKAKDLTAGLDDIGFSSEEPEAAPEPEPEPEPEAAPTRGRRGRGRATQTEELQEKEEELKDTPPAEEKPARGRGRAKKAAVEPEQPDEAQTEIAPDHLRVGTTYQQGKGAPAPRPADLVNRFGYHRATEETAPKHAQVRALLLSVAEELDSLVPEGREKSTVFTRLEEAMFWANAGIARTGTLVDSQPEAATPADDPAAAAQEAADESAPRRGRGRPRNDGTPAQPRTAEDKAATLVKDPETGEFKPRGRGRPRAGAETRKDV